MLVPTILTLDVFWTEEGVKILEVQHGRRSGEKGYQLLHDKSIRQSLVNPFINELKEQGWEWIGDPNDFHHRIDEEDMSKFIDGNFLVYQICTNKALQSALLPSLKPYFPKEEIFTFDRNWSNIAPRIESSFSENPEIVVKAPSQAVGHGIIPIKTSSVHSLGEDIDWANVDPMFWQKHIFCPAFTVQERVRPLPIEISGHTYEAPIRLWLALVPENGKLVLHRFGRDGKNPEPIYYKLPAPIGQGTYREQIMSDIHSGKAVANVPDEISTAIFSELSEVLPAAFQEAMSTSYEDAILKILSNGSEGARVIAFKHLMQSEQLLEDELDANSNFLDTIRTSFRNELRESSSFREYFELMLTFDDFYLNLIASEEQRNGENLLYDCENFGWKRISSNDFRDVAFKKLGVLVRDEDLKTDSFIQKHSEGGSRKFTGCSLIAP